MVGACILQRASIEDLRRKCEFGRDRPKTKESLKECI